jgi:type VI protein secretion system component Hcp
VAVNIYLTSMSKIFSVTRYTDGIPLDSLNFGGNDPNGFLTPTDVVVEMRSSTYSPLLLKAFVEQTSHTVVFKEYQPDRSGITRNNATITLATAKIVSFELAGTATSHVLDTVHFNFATLGYNRPTDGAEFVWQVA